MIIKIYKKKEAKTKRVRKEEEERTNPCKIYSLSRQELRGASKKGKK
jgi:hypothetical protein